MVREETGKDKPAPRAGATERRARLAAAMRENLKKRKRQQRAREEFDRTAGETDAPDVEKD